MNLVFLYLANIRIYSGFFVNLRGQNREIMAEQKEMNIEVKADVASGCYSNLAIITHSTSEFIIDFASNLPGLQRPTVQSRIIMTPEHAKRLLMALQDNINKYESNVGQINVGGPKLTFPMGGGNGNRN